MTNTIEKVYQNGTEYVIKDTTYSAGTGIDITGTTISNDGVLSVNSNTGAVTVTEFSPASSGSTGQVLTKTAGGYDRATVTGTTKAFTLSSTSDLVNAQAAYDFYVSGGTPIIEMSGLAYQLHWMNSSTLMFARPYAGGTGTTFSQIDQLTFTVSSGTVTTVTKDTNQIRVSSSAPSSGANSIITLVI